MFETIKDAVLINLYWFSLPLIGYVFLRIVSNIRKTPRSIKNISKYILRQHPLSICLFSFTITVFLCAVVSVFFYVFHLPVKALAILYLSVLLLACLYVANIFLRSLFKVTDLDIFKIRGKTLITKTLLLLMVAVLVMDFLVSLYIKSFAWGDAVYHMARVVNILSDGFNIQTSFFNNLPDGAYHYNVIYALYAVPSKILHLDPIRVWEFSLAFYRLMQWLAVFTLAMHVFGKWLKTGKSTLPLAFLSVISAIAFNSYHQGFIANYPNQVVSIWFILLIICLSLQSKVNNKAVGLVMVSLGFLLTCTHPTYAFIAACFIALLSLVRAIFDRNSFFANKYNLITYALTIITLMIGPIVTKLMPVRLSSDLINILEPNLINFFGMNMMKPVIPFDAIGWVVYIAGILTAAFLLIKLWKQRSKWSIMFALSTFFLIAYYTPAFMVLHHFLPVWVIERFGAMNVLEYLFATLGLYGLYRIVIWFIEKKISVKNKINITRTISVVFVVLSLFLSAVVALSTYKLFFYDAKSQSYAYTYMNQSAADFKDILKDNKVVVSSPYYSYQLSALFNIDVVAVEYGHSPMSSDGSDRTDCLGSILKNYNYQDLKIVKADYIVVSLTGEMKNEENIVKSKPYLKLIRSNQYFSVYEFDKKYNSDDTILPFHSCINYQRLEMN